MARWKIVAKNGTTGTYTDTPEGAIAKFCEHNQLHKLDIKTIEQL